MSSLKVINLHPSLTEEEFKNWFIGFGTVKQVSIKTEKNGGKCGYVNFFEESSAEGAYKAAPCFEKNGMKAKLLNPKLNSKHTSSSSSAPSTSLASTISATTTTSVISTTYTPTFAPVASMPTSATPVNPILNSSFLGDHYYTEPPTPVSQGSIRSNNSRSSISTSTRSSSVEKVMTSLETWQVKVLKRFFLEELNAILSVNHCSALIHSKVTIKIIGNCSDDVENACNTAREFVDSIKSRTFAIADQNSLTNFCLANKCICEEIFGQFEVYGQVQSLDKLSNLLLNSKNNSFGSKKKTETSVKNETFEKKKNEDHKDNHNDEKLNAAKKLFPKDNPAEKLDCIDHIKIEVPVQFQLFYNNVLTKYANVLYFPKAKKSSSRKIFYNKNEKPDIITTLLTEKPVVEKIVIPKFQIEFVKQQQKNLKTKTGEFICCLDVKIPEGRDAKIKIIAFKKDTLSIKKNIEQYLFENRDSEIKMELPLNEKFKYQFLKRHEATKNYFKDKFNATFFFSDKGKTKNESSIIRLRCKGNIKEDARQELVSLLEALKPTHYSTSFPMECAELVFATLCSYKEDIESKYSTVSLNLAHGKDHFKQKIKMMNGTPEYTFQVISRDDIPPDLDTFFKQVANYFANFVSKKITLPKGCNINIDTLSYEQTETQISVQNDCIIVASDRKENLEKAVAQINDRIKGLNSTNLFAGKSHCILKKHLALDFLGNQQVQEVKNAAGSGISFVVTNSDTTALQYQQLRTVIDTKQKQLVYHPIQLSSHEIYILQKEKQQLKKDTAVQFFYSTLAETTFHCGLYVKNTNLKENGSIEFQFGSIFDTDVEAIVNPANSKLEHKSGLASEILEKGGRYVKWECESYITAYKALLTGASFIGTAGALSKFRHIIHTVGPDYQTGKNNESKLLEITAVNLLKLAEAYKLASIAMPPISSGIFNYPIAECVSILTATVYDFLKTSKFLKRVVFCDNVDQNVSSWHMVFQNLSQKTKTALLKNRKISFTKAPPPVGLLATAFSKISSVIHPPKQWYWKDDDAKWKRYRSIEEEEINKNYLNNIFVFQLNIGKKIYTIDLKNMKQMNQTSKFIHEICNELPFKLLAQWYWVDDFKKWSPYSAVNSNLIEDGFKSKSTKFTLKLRKHADDTLQDYLFDFTKMTQKNLETNFERPIKRKELKQQEQAVLQDSIPVENDDDDDGEEFQKPQYLAVIGLDEQSVTTCVKSIQDYLAKCQKTIEVNFPNAMTYKKELSRILDSNKVKYTIKTNLIEICSYENILSNVRAEIFEYKASVANQLGDNLYPKEWDCSIDTILVPVVANSTEWQMITSKIASTLAVKVVEIKRVQNKILWRRYAIEREKVISKSATNSANERMLFHGTRTCPPAEIINGDEGFEARVSAAGMWGFGIYFAENASYSHAYHHQLPNTKLAQFFFASVIVGDTLYCNSNSNTQTFRMPPIKAKNSNSGATEYYDSVSGTTNGSNVFIVYSNARCYPSYLITYEF